MHRGCCVRVAEMLGESLEVRVCQCMSWGRAASAVILYSIKIKIEGSGRGNAAEGVTGARSRKTLARQT